MHGRMQIMPHSPRQSSFRPWRAKQGGVAVMVAVTLTALIGFAGLGPVIN
jgi:hypothetical protein